MAEITPCSDKDAREAFNLFDKLHEGKVEGKDIPNLLRSVGQNPTESDIKALIEGKEKTKFSFEEYLAIQNRPGGWKAQGTHQSFMDGFKVFDRDGKGLISAGELRYVLTSLGEKLTDRQVDELLSSVETDRDGMIKYEDFVKAILVG